jgi:hypothetical protein
MTDEILPPPPDDIPLPPSAPIPNVERPDMSPPHRYGFSHEETTLAAGDVEHVTTVITLPNSEKFAVEITGVPEDDIEKIIEDAIITRESRHPDPAIHTKATVPSTVPQEI